MSRRAPLIAAGAGLLVVLLMVVFLIMPKVSAVRIDACSEQSGFSSCWMIIAIADGPAGAGAA